MDISVLLGFHKLSILISSQTRWVAVNPYMTCRLYDIDVYTYDHTCIQITILTSNFHLYTSFTHACPSDSHCNDSAKRWYNLLWLSVAPCTACNSENCPPQPRASWPSTFQILSAANWIFQNRESEHDVSSRIILSQNGFRCRQFNGGVLRMWKSRHKIWDTLALHCVILRHVGIFRGETRKLRSFSFSSPLTELISQLKLNWRWNLVEPSG